jgi:lysozyme
MKKILFVLALWFLGEWFVYDKFLPFLAKGLKIGNAVIIPPKKNSDSTIKTDTTVTPVADSIKNKIDTTGWGKRLNSKQKARGIDISHYEGNQMNFIRRKTDSLAFIICKATEGINELDTSFKRNWAEIKAKKFIRGSYHFYHCYDDPVAQADYYLSVTGALVNPDFPPIVDVEEASIKNSCSKSDIIPNLLKMLQRLEQKTGRIPIIYTDNNIGNAYLNDASLARYPLWIAYYSTTATNPKFPSAWRNNGWAIWQKTDSYPLTGITDDFDVFNGNLLQLLQFNASH